MNAPDRDVSRPSRRIDELRIRQADGWRGGRGESVETLLGDWPDLAADAEATLELICAELLLRDERGESPTADEYVARFPQWAAEVRRQFLIHDLFRTLADPDSPTAMTNAAAPSEPDAGPSRAATAPPAVPGYELLGELGRGGMGVVHLARHLALDRLVALKILRDSPASAGSSADRFHVEARSVARLRHPDIVQIYDFGEHDGRPWLSLEYVPGVGLDKFCSNRPQPIREAVALVERLARAVACAHRQGVVHRDLKPANILLAPSDATTAAPGPSDATGSAPHVDGRGVDPSAELSQFHPKIVDFGLAKSLEDGVERTGTDMLLGTAAYMAPEQAWGRSKEIGPAVDVHGLGLILYELLTGVAPLRRESLAATLDAVRFFNPPAPSRRRRGIPAELDAVCARCLAKRPHERYTDAEGLADDLRRWLDGRRPDAGRGPAWRRATRRFLPLMLVAALLLVAWRLRSTDSPPSDSPSAPKDDASPASVARELPAAPVRTRGESFALLVGVRSYRLPGATLDLDYTEADVDELSRLLLRRGFPRSNIRLLTQWSEADNRALAPTKANILARLRELAAGCIEDDTLLIAVTGMGGDGGVAGGYRYLPADADPDRPDTLLALADFYRLLADCPARTKLLLIDTCQTADGRAFSEPPATAAPPEGTAVLFACSPGEASYEDPTLRHGVFSYHVLQALEGAADRNADRVVTLDELAEYARVEVPKFLADDQRQQTPAKTGPLNGAAPIVRLP